MNVRYKISWITPLDEIVLLFNSEAISDDQTFNFVNISRDLECDYGMGIVGVFRYGVEAMQCQWAICASCGVSLLLMGNVIRARPSLTEAQQAICYWEFSSGRTIDLSSVCGMQTAPQPSAGLVLPDSLQRYSEDIQKQVKHAIQSNPRRFLTKAKTACRVLRYGAVQAATVQRQALSQRRSDPVSLAQQQMVVDYAIANYCPQFR